MILDFETAFQIVKEYLKAGNYSPATIKAEYYTLRRFNEYLKSRDKGLEPSDFRDVTEKDYYGFMRYLEKQAEKRGRTGLKPNTYRHHTEHLKMGFAVLESEEKIIQNPFAEIEGVRVEKKFDERVLTEAEMEAVLNAVDESTLTGMRDKVILEVLYGTGIRRKELIGLELGDYLEEEKMLLIRQGKGGKDRVLPLGDKVNGYLKLYIKRIRPKLAENWRRRIPKTKAVFLNQSGGKLHECSLVEIFRAIEACLAEKSGISKTVTPHIIRHSFATHLISHGADVREVQLLLGHASIDSTEVYLNLSTAHLREVYEKYHPLENELYFDAESRESYIIEMMKKRDKNQ